MCLFLQSLDVLAQSIASTDTTRVFTMRGTYYSDRFVGRKTSSGEVFVQDKYTAAHHTLKFGTLLLVTNPKNGKEVIVRINDRCPKDRIVDMTLKAARQIGITSHPVEVRILSERYRPLWESQDLISNILSEGRLKEMIDKGFSLEKILSKASSNNNGVSTKSTDDRLYNLELLSNSDLSEARARVRRLPVIYQEQVVYKNPGRPGGVSVVLELSASRESVEAVKKEINSIFPESKIVPFK